MSHILLTGIAVLDIINYVDSYPLENSEIRASSQQIRRGGNASNTATILSHLNHQCTLAANLSKDSSGEFIKNDLAINNIKLSTSHDCSSHSTPTSYITLNTQNGSRTIVHYRDLPELSFNKFNEINLAEFDWLHFEGRDIDEVKKMMLKAHQYSLPISLEIEKQRNNIESLIPLADIIIFSKPFAQSLNFVDARRCLEYFNSIYADKTFVCTWGSEGAFSIHKNTLLSSPAFYIEKAIDTIGAGDTFIAGYIHAQLNKLNPQNSLIYACKLAGLKCTKNGFDNLDLSNVE